MPKKTPRLDIDDIIANNPKVDRDTLKKGIEALERLHRTGVVKPESYGLETPDSVRTVRFSYEEGEIRRGSTIRLRER